MQHLRIERNDDVANVVLDRPPLNIVDLEAIEELAEAFHALRYEDCKVVVLKAEGETFSAGAAIEDHLPGPVDEMIPAFGEVFKKLWALEQPTVAVVQGKALGGGMELALGCDFIIASDDATFGQPEIKVGVFPPIACLLLPRLLPWSSALDLILTGRNIDASEAHQLGLVNRVVPTDELDDAVDDFVERFTGLSGSVLKRAKRAAVRGRGEPGELHEALDDIERIYLDDLMTLEDPVEGLKAFTERRKPEWKEC